MRTALPPSTKPNLDIMGRRVQAPHIFYRVEDEDSDARYYPNAGIFAGARVIDINLNPYKDPSLHEEVERHLDWRNRISSPFISVYSDQEVACKEAERRVKDGKMNVRLRVIDTMQFDQNSCLEYRRLRRLAKKLGLYIEKNA